MIRIGMTDLNISSDTSHSVMLLFIFYVRISVMSIEDSTESLLTCYINYIVI